MKQKLSLIISIIIIFSFQSIFANGLSLNSVGTRALGMGGAFVGLANDGTAIYWNPSGLAFQKSSLSLSVTGIRPSATYNFQYPAFGINADAQTEGNIYFAPNLFGVYNFGKLTVGLGIYVPAGLGVEWDGADLVALSGGQSMKWMSRIAAINISPAIAYQVSEQFGLGVALNVYYGMFEMERPAEFTNPANGQTAYSQYTEDSDGIGFGVTVGALYKVNKMFQVGATFRTKSTVPMSGTAENAAFAALGAAGKSDFDRDVAWPMWISGGVAVMPIENLTLTLDAQYSQWSESENEFQTEFKDQVWAGAAAASGDDKFILRWDDATQIRFGAEFMATETVALRAGFYYDPAPAPDETLIILFPSSTNYAVTAGAGFLVEKLTVDISLEYLFGAERNISADLANPLNPMEGFANAQPGLHQMDIFAFSFGLGYRL